MEEMENVQTTQRKEWLARAISYCWTGSDDPVEVMVKILCFFDMVSMESKFLAENGSNA